MERVLNYRRSRVFRDFLEERDSLHLQFRQGDLTKREFIELNLAMNERIGLKPFEKIDSLEKGIYTYQYYNMMAKHTYLRARDEFKNGKHPEIYRQLVREADHYYYEKDRTTQKLLRYLDYENMEAYPIRVKSEELKDKLIEIVIHEPEFIVLHSTSKSLRELLEEKHVFDPHRKRSVLNEYVNQRY